MSAVAAKRRTMYQDSLCGLIPVRPIEVLPDGDIKCRVSRTTRSYRCGTFPAGELTIIHPNYLVYKSCYRMSGQRVSTVPMDDVVDRIAGR